MRPFQWNNRRERAAQFVADDQLSNEQIARNLGVTRQAVDIWKRHPDFQERIREIVARTRDAILAAGIAERQNRINASNDRWRRMQQVIDERAKAPEFESVPGGKTGLLVKQIKIGRDGSIVEEFAVDTGLLRELREHEKQAAIEKGQWTEKTDVVSDGKKIPFALLMKARADADHDD